MTMTKVKTTKPKVPAPQRIEDAGRLLDLYEKKIKGNKSQIEFGVDSGIGSQGMVYQYLQGKRPLNIVAATKFAAAMGCKISDFSPSLAKDILEAARYVEGAGVWPHEYLPEDRFMKRSKRERGNLELLVIEKLEDLEAEDEKRQVEANTLAS